MRVRRRELSRQLSQQEIDAVFENEAGAQAGGSRRQVRFPPARPHRQVPGAGHPPAARHVRAQPGLQPFGLFALLSDREPGQRGAAFLRRVPGRPAVTHLHGLAGLSPYDGNGVLELNPSLVFPILEMLLGGTGKSSARSNATSPKSSRSCWMACSASFCMICERPGKPSPLSISPSNRWKPSRNCCT